MSVDISKPESYKHYIAENRNAFRKYGARFLIRGGKSEVVEGTGRTRIVVIEFKDYATALECYHSPEYAKAIEIRKGSNAVTDIIIAGITVRSQRTGKSMPRTLGCCCAAQWKAFTEQTKELTELATKSATNVMNG